MVGTILIVKLFGTKHLCSDLCAHLPPPELSVHGYCETCACYMLPIAMVVGIGVSEYLHN